MSIFVEKEFLIHPYKGNKGLAEIYQSMQLKIALAKRDKDGAFTVKTPGVLCRDFLCDVYSSSVQKYKFGIYGMSWDGATEEPDWDAVYLHLTYPNTKAKADFDNNSKFLHEIETRNGITPTAFYNIGERSAFAIGDRAWLQNNLTASLYTFLLRSFCYELKTDDWIKELGAQSHSDSRYIASIDRSAWDRILGDIKSIHTEDFCGLDFAKDGIGAVHHNSGFVSVFGKHSEMNQTTVKKNKHWKIMRERGFKLYTN